MNRKCCSLLMMFAVCHAGALFVPGLAGGTENDDPDFRAPPQPFAGEGRGPYETGTFEQLWVNEALEDPSTAKVGDKRKLMVQVWYPALLPREKNTVLAPYAISPLLYGKDSWARQLGHVQTQSALGVPVAPGRFPVLIYNPGGGNPHFSGTFQTEFLASHGYVVVAIGHPGANGIERFPDGTSYENDGAKWMARTPEGSNLAQREELEIQWTQSDVALYVKDISFILDRLAAQDVDPRNRLYGRLDLQRVGSLGWSFGGFISLQATREEPRVKAAANFDGGPFGLMGPNGVVTWGSERPVLLMFNDKADRTATLGGEVDVNDMEVRRASETYYWEMLRRSTADWYRVIISRTSHASFSDHPLFKAANPQDLYPQAAHAIINAYTLEFFNKYVRGGTDDTPLLSGRIRFPEATMLRQKKEKDIAAR